MRQPRKDEERASVGIIPHILPRVASILETCPGPKEMAGCQGYLSVLPLTFRFDLRPEWRGRGWVSRNKDYRVVSSYSFLLIFLEPGLLSLSCYHHLKGLPTIYCPSLYELMIYMNLVIITTLWRRVLGLHFLMCF